MVSNIMNIMTVYHNYIRHRHLLILMFPYIYGDIMDCKRCHEYFIKVCLVNSTSIDCKEFLVVSRLPRRTKSNFTISKLKKDSYSCVYISLPYMFYIAAQNIAIISIDILAVSINKNLKNE